MQFAVNRINETQGGIVIVDNQKLANQSASNKLVDNS